MREKARFGDVVRILGNFIRSPILAQALAWLDQRKRDLETVPIVAPVILRLRNPYREAFPDYRDLWR